jgi:NhaP-type Na+/H+ or K+/H+ antiporter
MARLQPGDRIRIVWYSTCGAPRSLVGTCSHYVGASFHVRSRKDDQLHGCTDYACGGLLVVVAVLSALAQRLQIPAAILLLLGGLLLSFFPGMPSADLNPDLVLFLFLPPLIYAAAWQSSWREFRAALQPILLLAIGLVLVTTTMIAVVAHSVVGLPWSVALVLGAIVSPTDAEALHPSEVLATLSAGLYLSRQSVRFFSSNTRLQANAVWNVLVFLLNGLLFLLIGLQLRAIPATIGPASWPAFIRDALVICLTVILVRIVWVFTASYLPQLVRPRGRQTDSALNWPVCCWSPGRVYVADCRWLLPLRCP